jgi:predicted DNA binding protein
MSVVVEFTLGPERLVLAETLSSVAVRLDIEEVTALAPVHPSLFVWVEAPEGAERADLEAFDAAARADPTVTDVEVLSEVDGKRLYSMRLTDETEVVLYPEWGRLGAVPLGGQYADGRWYLQSRFPDRAAAVEFREFLESHGVEYQIDRLYDSETVSGLDDGLTPEQRETLQLAYERGYFDVPRGITTAMLAEELGVSDQAVSERLRRGYARLVERALEPESE